MHGGIESDLDRSRRGEPQQVRERRASGWIPAVDESWLVLPVIRASADRSSFCTEVGELGGSPTRRHLHKSDREICGYEGEHAAVRDRDEEGSQPTRLAKWPEDLPLKSKRPARWSGAGRVASRSSLSDDSGGVVSALCNR